MDSRYLEYLLGLETRYAVAPPNEFRDSTLPDQAFADAWLLLEREHPGAYIGTGPTVAPDWGSAKFTYTSSRDFQDAVYLLLSESWRAKVCRHCKKYFIADKGSQVYCSPACQ